MRTAALLPALFALVAASPRYGTNTSLADTEGRALLSWSVSPPRRFTDKALSKAPACSDPAGFTGYCVGSTACRAFNGTAGARCPKRPAGAGFCCLVDRCPVAPPSAPTGGVVATSPIPTSGSPTGTRVAYICMPGLVFEGLTENTVTSTCDTRGNWSPSIVPGCVTAPPSECVDPPPAAPEGTMVSDTGNHTIGALVFYLCETGTFPDGQAMTAARCGEDGGWSPETIPGCAVAPPAACADLPPPAPAGVTQHHAGDLEIGAQAIYVCDVAEETFPSATTFLVATCSEEGVWEPNAIPTCQV